MHLQRDTSPSYDNICIFICTQAHKITENLKKKKKTKIECPFYEYNVSYNKCQRWMWPTDRITRTKNSNNNNDLMQCAIERKTKTKTKPNGQSKSIFMLHLSLLLPVSRLIGMPACRMVIRSVDQHNLWCMTLISSSNDTVKLYRIYSIWLKSINKHILLRVIHLSNTMQTHAVTYLLHNKTNRCLHNSYYKFSFGRLKMKTDLSFYISFVCDTSRVYLHWL